MKQDHTSTCGKCSFWEEIPHTTTGFGNCVMAASQNGVPSNSKSLAVAVDYEDYCAFLRTSPNFGCVQFEPK